MIFLAANTSNVFLKAFEASFALEPLTYPKINLSHILVMEDELARRILKRNNGEINRIQFDAQKLPGYPKPLSTFDAVPDGSRILLIRGGGIGDVFMCTPAIREFKQYLPHNTHLTFATFKKYEPLFRNHPDIDAVITQPITLKQLMEADYYFEFMDPTSRMDSTHLTDFYLSCLGIDPNSVNDKTPSFSEKHLLDPAVSQRIQTEGDAYRYTVYLNGLASDKLRDISPENLSILPEAYPGILFVFPKAYVDRYPDSKTRLSQNQNILFLDTKDTFEGYITALHSCHAVVTTDSSAYHIAAALNKPGLVLFGPIDARLRTKYYATIRSMEANYQGITCSSPCGKSMCAEFYPENVSTEDRCPEAKHGGELFSPCLNAFDSERLIDEFDRILARCAY